MSEFSDRVRAQIHYIGARGGGVVRLSKHRALPTEREVRSRRLSRVAADTKALTIFFFICVLFSLQARPRDKGQHDKSEQNSAHTSHERGGVLDGFYRGELGVLRLRFQQRRVRRQGKVALRPWC